MRRLAVFAALTGLIFAPMAPAGAAATETADIYSNGDVQGPSFARATKCTAVFSVSLNAVEEGTEDYDSLFNIARAWLRWSKRIADGRDVEGEISTKSAALNNSFGGAESRGLHGCAVQGNQGLPDDFEHDGFDGTVRLDL